MAQVFLGHFSEDEGIHYVCLVANNRVHQESDEETRNENENILQDGEENEMNKTIMKMVSKMMQYFLTTNKTLKTLKSR